MIERTILPDLLAHLQEPEITVLLGPRQVGKTTLMSQMQEHLKQQFDPNDAIVLSYNLDLNRDRMLFGDQQNVIDTINLSRGDRRAYIFIDEVQRIPDAGRFLKGIFDQAGKTCKLIISGSSALEIHQQVGESLTGRKRVFQIRPLSYFELLHYYHPESINLEEFARLRQDDLAGILEQYLLFGGYPRIVTAASRREKIMLLEEIFESYLQKDIVSLLQIDKLTAYTRLTTLLAGQIGNLVNASELAGTTGVSGVTISRYLSYLEATFVLSLVRPYATNPRTEISKMPKIYFHDPGLRNFALQRFTPLSQREDKGALFENLVYLLLEENLSPPWKLNYWRTKSGAEVDFVLSLGSTQPLPIEVKAHTAHSPKISRGLLSFVEKYHPEKSVLITLQKTASAKTVSDTDILPFFEIPKLLTQWQDSTSIS